MAKSKGTILAGRRLTYALDRLSKDALIDLIVDRARTEIGEDACDEDIADLVQMWANPVMRIREDRAVFLRGMLTRLDRIDAEVLRREQPRAKPVRCSERLLAALAIILAKKTD